MPARPAVAAVVEVPLAGALAGEVVVAQVAVAQVAGLARLSP